MTKEMAAKIKISNNRGECYGAWTIQHLHQPDAMLQEKTFPTPCSELSIKHINHMDTAGAWSLVQLSQLAKATIIDAKPAHAQLLNLVRPHQDSVIQHIKDITDQEQTTLWQRSVTRPLQSVGQYVVEHAHRAIDIIEFVGRFFITISGLLLRPWRWRWRIISEEIYLAGFTALSIVGLLSFLVGVVITYQGGVVLADYGANLYIVDLVGLTMLRELSPLVTAIIVAGRTGSAYTAQIGTMQVTEEVDALRSLGISPIEYLVWPKFIALLLVLPLLTVYADLMGLLGGMFMSSALFSISPATFIDRLHEALKLSALLTGVGKTPVFAMVIATVGCYQGFRVFKSAASVGRQTTISVVQSIALVIVIDALFSVAFSKLGI